eukprot:5361082-Lingulodinium_polyedra.AAC.1
MRRANGTFLTASRARRSPGSRATRMPYTLVGGSAGALLEHSRNSHADKSPAISLAQHCRQKQSTRRVLLRPLAKEPHCT